MECSCGMEVSKGSVEYSGCMEVSSVERPIARPPYSLAQPSRPRPYPPPLPLPRPRISCILTTVDDAGDLMDGLCDGDVSSFYAAMQWSSLIRR